jgi:hypothetical protein
LPQPENFPGLVPQGGRKSGEKDSNFLIQLNNIFHRAAQGFCCSAQFFLDPAESITILALLQRNINAALQKD